jgi:ligand-binding sensor domain-containing protein
MKYTLLLILILATTLTNAQQWEQIKSLNNVRKIAIAENGDIWTLTHSGIVHYKGDTPILYDSINTTSILNYAWWINDMEIDHDGNIWIATAQGFGKFDGTEWEGLYQLPRYSYERMNDIEIDKNGSIWFGYSVDYRNGDLGLSKFEGETWENWGTNDGLISNTVNSIATDENNNIWIGTPKGVSMFNGSSFTNYKKGDGLINSSITTVKIDKKGNKWFGSANGLSKFNGDNWTTFTTDDGMISNNIKTIEIHSDSSIYIGTDKGISVFNGESWISYTKADGLQSVNIYSLKENKQGKMLAATDVGLFKFNGTNWTSTLKDSSLISNYIYDIIIDEIDNLWIATNNGISISSNGNWNTYNTQTGFPFVSVYSIIIDNEKNKWISHTNGISKFDGTFWTHYTSEDGLISNNVNTSAIDPNNNNIWIGTEEGLSNFNGSTWVNYTIDNGLVNNNVHAVFFDSENNMWIGTSKGVSKFNGQEWEKFTLSFDYSGFNSIDRGSNYINCIGQDVNGNIWAGTGFGIWAYDGIDWKPIITAGEGERIYGGIVDDIEKDDYNNMWFGSQMYLTVMVFNGVEWKQYSFDEGLPDHNIHCIFIDEEDRKWFGTFGGGISILNEKLIPPAVNLSKDSLKVFSDEVSSDTLSLTTFAAWNISCDEDWVNFIEYDGDRDAESEKSSNTFLSNELNGEGNSAIIVNTDENPTSNERTATITISAYGEIIKTIPLTQAGKTTAVYEISEKEIKVYPNPVKDVLYIQTQTDFSKLLYEIRSIDGKLMYSSRQQNRFHEIDMNSFSKGTYLLRIVGNSNTRNLKIVKQ